MSQFGQMERSKCSLCQLMIKFLICKQKYFKLIRKKKPIHAFQYEGNNWAKNMCCVEFNYWKFSGPFSNFSKLLSAEKVVATNNKYLIKSVSEKRTISRTTEQTPYAAEDRGGARQQARCLECLGCQANRGHPRAEETSQSNSGKVLSLNSIQLRMKRF